MAKHTHSIISVVRVTSILQRPIGLGLTSAILRRPTSAGTTGTTGTYLRTLCTCTCKDMYMYVGCPASSPSVNLRQVKRRSPRIKRATERDVHAASEAAPSMSAGNAPRQTENNTRHQCRRFRHGVSLPSDRIVHLLLRRRETGHW